MLDLECLFPEIRAWFEALPEPVRDCALRYPAGIYLVKDGAPYRITAPGCFVRLDSYGDEPGIARVLVVESTPESDFAVGMLSAQARLAGRTVATAIKLDDDDAPAAVREVPLPETGVGISAVVELEWLELVEVAVQLHHAWTP